MMPIRVAIGLGSNIDAQKNLTTAAQMLRKAYPAVRFSHVYTTAARDYEDQDDFLNAVAVFETTESVEMVAGKLRAIETALGKALPFQSGPRTIDIDVLLYGDLVTPSREEWLNQKPETRNQKLFVPHTRMHERRFVLEPLSELIDQSERHPKTRKTWKELLEATQEQGSKKTAIGL